MVSRRSVRPDRPIFLVGCPRSGTTLLQLMLHAHPRLAVPPENRYVLPAYYRRTEWGDLRDPGNRRRLAEFITAKRVTFENWGIDRAEVRERVRTSPPTLGSALDVTMRCYTDKHRAARWCDKRPMYVRHVPALRRMFPDAQFVHLIRDGRATTASLLRTPWFRGDVAQAVGTWRLAMDNARRARARLPVDSWLDLRYEQLITQPEVALRRLCDYLGEDFDPVMLTPSAVQAQVVPRRKTWHANTARPLLPERVESWRTELDADEIAFAETVIGDELRAAGYPTGSPDVPDVGVSRRRVLHFAMAYRRRRLWYRRREVGDTWAAARERLPVATLL